MITSRRNVIAGVSVGVCSVVSGCSLFEQRSTPADLEVNNYLGTTVSLKILVRNTDANAVVLERTVEVPPDGERAFQDPIPKNGNYSLRVSTQSGMSTDFEWMALHQEGGVPDQIDVSIGERGIQVSVTSA